MSTLTYTALVEQLFPRLTGGIRWGLERTERLLAAVGNPHRRYPTIHVGGTNGKGSVSATLASVLHAQGLRTGLYTSPHLCTFRERIQIDGVPIGEAELLYCAQQLMPHIEREGASFFEATTAIGFLALAEANVDIAVIEVGLGGRLDSTNVITPLVSVITNVSLDHVQLLGSTIDAVAREKAGIIKKSVPVVTSEHSGTAAQVLQEHATSVGAPVHAVAPDAVAYLAIGRDGTALRTSCAAYGSLTVRTPLVGLHQGMNTALAVHAAGLLPERLRPTREAVLAGTAAVKWPGRLQQERINGRPWVFDVAHNVAGVSALVAALDAIELPRPASVLVGVLGDKDWESMLRPLAAWADHLVLTTPPTAPADRRWDLQRVAATLGAAKTDVIEDFANALRLVGGAGTPGAVVVTGSFHTVGDALAMLGRCPHGSDVALPMVDFSA